MYYHILHDTIPMASISFKEEIILLLSCHNHYEQDVFLALLLLYHRYTTNDKFVLPHNNDHNPYRQELFHSFALEVVHNIHTIVTYKTYNTISHFCQIQFISSQISRRDEKWHISFFLKPSIEVSCGIYPTHNDFITSGPILL